jgi:PAS domain S-box-containing protein
MLQRMRAYLSRLAPSVYAPKKLRSHLLLLGAATLLPMIALAVLAATLFIQREREVFQRGATDRIRALVTALDAELNGHIEALYAVSSSIHLETDNLRDFHDDALRALKSQPDWFTVHVALPSGRQVVNAVLPFGSPLNDIAERRSFDRVLETKQRVVGDIFRGPVSGRHEFVVRVPVLRTGAVRYVVSAVIKTEVVYRLLSPQQLPPDWVGVVLDQNNRIVARTVAPDTSVGQLASDSLQAALARSAEGWFRGNTIEGHTVYTPYRRSEFSGWTLAMGIPAAAVEAAERATIWTMTSGIVTATFLALLLALGVSSRLSAPIASLASAARMLGHGEDPNLPRNSEIEEVGYLAKALEDAGAAIRAREEIQARLAAIVDSSRDAIASYSLEGNVLTWNHGAEELFGYSAEESHGRHVSFLVPLDRSHEPDEIFSAVRRGEPCSLETVRLKKDGTRVDVALSVSPIRNASGTVVGFSAMKSDITERKNAERALQEANRRKDEFMAMLGHELRNPISIISTAVQVLGRLRPLPETKLEEIRDMIGRQVDHTSRMLDDLLDVSRISHGKIQLNKEHWNLRDIIVQTVEDHRNSFRENDLSLELSVVDRPLPIFGDRTRLAQAFGNLLSNARKFTEPGGTVVVKLDSVDQTSALLSVNDTGIGMEPEMLRWVFEPFSQADDSLDRSRGGLGLGLALVKGIVEFHGGEVTASSDGPGRGSTFTIRLPLEPGVSSSIPTLLRRDGTVSSHRVLVIEDNPVTAQNMCTLLELSGHMVKTALSGPDGIEAAREFRPEIVLCDIGLPGLDGYGVARALREDLRLTDAYLIAVSGYAQDENRARKAGFNAHILKPFNMDKLEELVVKLKRDGANSLAS